MILDQHRFRPRPAASAERVGGVPFGSPEEAWFWSVQSHDAKAEGARVTAGRGLVPRPCEPGDVLRAVDRLYRQRRLVRDHLHVLVHYGRRLMAPDPDRFREQRACTLWREAFAHLGPLLREKGIVQGGIVQ
ncbi:MAG TPA: hypothetical protein VGE72_05350 [Azospirillum sp.]